LKLLRMGIIGSEDGMTDDGDSEVACRFCLVDSGELVAPCECKGSSAWVHVGCLRQWQKSVMMTQSTHPRYQTHIDEVRKAQTPWYEIVD
jgi:E3 ubiquitin-protein ligase DOA10